VVRKFFVHDKNYLLEAAQLRLQDRLLQNLVEKAKVAYGFIHNPLGLNDQFSEQIKACHSFELAQLETFYLNLAGIYRYKFGENQLDFLWDGRDHTEKYEEEWMQTFDMWTNVLCGQLNFVQAVLDLTVFFPASHPVQMTENRMNAAMTGFFELKIHKQKGIQEMKVVRN
jgi:hypothetical protein